MILESSTIEYTYLVQRNVIGFQNLPNPNKETATE